MLVAVLSVHFPPEEDISAVCSGKDFGEICCLLLIIKKKIQNSEEFSISGQVIAAISNSRSNNFVPEH